MLRKGILVLWVGFASFITWSCDIARSSGDDGEKQTMLSIKLEETGTSYTFSVKSFIREDYAVFEDGKTTEGTTGIWDRALLRWGFRKKPVGGVEEKIYWIQKSKEDEDTSGSYSILVEEAKKHLFTPTTFPAGLETEAIENLEIYLQLHVGEFKIAAPLNMPLDFKSKLEPSVGDDADQDGLPDAIDPDDNNWDTDGDSIPDGADVDVDGDGTNDNGIDSDNDGINDRSDVDEIGGTDADGDNIADTQDPINDNADADQDGLPDAIDPDDNNWDTDGDKIPDGADVDVDGDGTNDNGIDNNNDGRNDHFTSYPSIVFETGSGITPFASKDNPLPRDGSTTLITAKVTVTTNGGVPIDADAGITLAWIVDGILKMNTEKYVTGKSTYKETFTIKGGGKHTIAVYAVNTLREETKQEQVYYLNSAPGTG